MLTLFGDLASGNVHKVQMILTHTDHAYRRVDTAQARGEPRSPEFRAINPMGKVPTLLFDDGSVLSESGAILHYFGQGTDLWPDDARGQAEVLRWMFYEQYNLEPSLAVIRYLRRHDTSEEAAGRIDELAPKARQALEVLEQRLQDRAWIAVDTCTIADLAVYPYTRWMDESGFDPAGYPAVEPWLARVEDRDGFLPMGSDGAAETITFSRYCRTG